MKKISLITALVASTLITATALAATTPSGPQPLNGNTPYFTFEPILTNGQHPGSGAYIDSFNAKSAPNAAFYQNIPPIAKRTVLVPGQVGMQAMLSFSTSQNPVGFIAGSNELTNGNVKNFQAWDYTESFVYFGGYIAEGEILVPSPGSIMQAHKNGVPAYGTVFFNQNNADETTFINTVLSQPKYQQLYAQKLIAMAQAYHFDGYFINNEAAENVASNEYFMPLVQALLKAGIKVEWYQVGDGNINQMLQIQDKNYSIFPDYGVDMNLSNYPTSQYNRLYWGRELTWGRPRFQDIINTYVYANVKNAHPVASLFATNRVAMNTTNNNVTPSLSSEYLSKNWVDWVVDNGYLYEPTVGNQFVTTFNTGSGSNYTVNGQVALNTPWNDMSDTDYASNYASFKNHMYSIDYSQSWLGGSSLQVNSNLPFVLYNTAFNTSGAANIVLVYKGNLNGSAISLNGVNYPIASTGSLNNGWQLSVVPLSPNQSKTTISTIGLVNCKDISLGEIYIGANQTQQTLKVMNPSANVYAWKALGNGYQYLCYDANGNLIGATALSAMYSSVPVAKVVTAAIVPVSNIQN